VTPEELYELNPAFHRWATDPNGPHFLLLPVDGAQVFTENITQLSDDQRMPMAHYTVHKGDSVVSVAKHFNTSVNVIRELNGLPAGRLTVGSDLSVPNANAVELPAKVMLAAARVDGKVKMNRRERRVRVRVVHAGESLWSIARRHHMNVNTLASLNGLHPGDSLHAGQRIKFSAPSTGSASHSSSGRRVVYVVRAGDTLRQIAKLFQVSVAEILSWNGMSSATHILKGQKLTIRVAARGG
jgi:membrane-bound lytic murein transglycosylase D